MSIELKNVYQLISAVALELAQYGISKSQRNPQGAGYNFRGIDDVYNNAGPLLAKYGLNVMPRCIERECVERTSLKGSALFYVVVRMEFDFISAHDGSKHTIAMFGEAMDSGDKATNKAMSAAYKYAILQAFCIPTEGDNDADSSTHEVAPKTSQTRATANQKPKALPAYTDEQLSKNSAAWRAAINAGKISAAGIIEKVSSGFTLTSEQEAAILLLASDDFDVENAVEDKQ